MALRFLSLEVTDHREGLVLLVLAVEDLGEILQHLSQSPSHGLIPLCHLENPQYHFRLRETDDRHYLRQYLLPVRFLRKGCLSLMSLRRKGLFQDDEHST